MISRASPILIGMAVCVFAGAGFLFAQGVLLTWATASVLVGGYAAACARLLQPRTLVAVRFGIAVTAVVMAVGGAAIGLVVLLGAATAWVVPPLLGLGGAWAWGHRHSWTGAVNAILHDHPTRPCTAQVGTADDRARDGAPQAVPALVQQLLSLQPASTSTTELCGAWQRSYWLLLELPAGPAHTEVTRIRRDLLDELERRDPVGFTRWLHTDPRPGSDPGRFLAAGH